MKITIGISGGNNSSSSNTNDVEMTGPLILASDPTQSLEVATKHYVDTAFTNLNANNISTGTLSASRLPSFTGDLISNQGSNTVTLINSGVTPGDYPKITIDSKGRVTNGSKLSNSDMPNFDWSKIVNKPTTLDGYGITNALRKTGGTINGNLAGVNPTSNMGAVTKNYADANLTNITFKTGDIVRKPTSITPPGFLRCNGAILNKTTYANLYAVIGDTFNNYLTPGSGKPWKQQYQINDTQTSNITGWTTSTSLPGPLGRSQAIVTKNRVYLLSGTNGSSYVPTVYTAPINSDGTLGAWTTDTSLPGTLGISQAIVTKNRVYLLGGYNNSNWVSTVYTAPINSDGTLGAWATGTSLPNGFDWSQAIVTKNRVYLLGGWTGSNVVSTVYTAPINLDGTLGAWTTGTSLPGVLASSQAIVTKNRVYLLGGWVNSGIVSTVYTASIFGGLNDYSPYYDGSISPLDTSTSFMLPDLTAKEKENINFYIVI